MSENDLPSDAKGNRIQVGDRVATPDGVAVRTDRWAGYLPFFRLLKNGELRTYSYTDLALIQR